MPRTFADDKTVNRVEAALLLKKSPGTLAVWASTGKYNLPYTMSGGEAQYWVSDLEKHLNDRLTCK